MDEQRRGRFRAYLAALLANGEGAKVMDLLGGLHVPKPYSLRMKVLYSETSPLSVLQSACEGGVLRCLSDSQETFTYHCEIGRKHRRKVEVAFAVCGFQDHGLPESVQAVVAVCTRDEWGALTRFLKAFYPRLVPVLLSQKELINVTQRLKGSSRHAVHVREYSAREPLHSRSGRDRSSVRKWTDEALDEVLMMIRDRRQIITSIVVEFFPLAGAATHIEPSVSCKIRRSGEIEVDGNLTVAFSAVASDIARVGHQKLVFFSKRGLREAEYKARPLAINYSQPVFEDANSVRTLVETLTRYPHSMHAVHHGNPYAHVKLTDMSDLSAFEVWAVPPSRLVLSPGLRTSAASVERLVDYIFENFREGDVASYEPAGFGEGTSKSGC